MSFDDLERPDPNTLLDAIKKKTDADNKGKLKIFFGMVAGVGKTYQMLLEARNLSKEGVDVAVGYVETHGRAETNDMLKGLEIVKRRQLTYRNVEFEEMDIDAILKRRPQLILVDELAHTNVPGSRHKKRYQDIIELLDNGIDVFTTVNIQHLESQSSTVEEITGIKIRETISDSILELADKIELIDITPEELQKRLLEGKIYLPNKIESASKNFFHKENLTALREMSLQFTAKMVDKELLHYLQENKIQNTWKSTDRILVAISKSPYTEYLIRWTKKTAINLKASWSAVYVESHKKLSPKEQESLNKNIELVRELGAEVFTISDDDIVNGIIRIAKKKNITQIIIGKPLRKSITELLSRNSITERLIKESMDIDIYLVSAPGIKTKKRRLFFSDLLLSSKPKEYLIVTFIIFLITLINLFFNQFIGYWALGLIFMAAIAILAGFFGKGPIFWAALLSALLWDVIFIPPQFTFIIHKIDDALMLMIYFVIALITGNLTSQLHTKETLLVKRENHISDLYEMTSDLSRAINIDDIVEKAQAVLMTSFSSESAIILSDDKGQLNTTPHPKSTLKLTEKEFSIAAWSFVNKKPAGKFTNTLSMSDIHYVPLITPDSTVGVLAIQFNQNFKFNIEHENLIENLSHQVAITIERENLADIKQKTLVLSESEKLYQIILNSVSHELRTPITTISFAASGLLDETLFNNKEIKDVLCNDIVQATIRLNRTVGNLLDMARIESGKLKLNLQWFSIEDLISVVFQKLEKELSAHTIRREISRNLPMIQIDLILMDQVLTNLLLNAVNHSIPQSVIGLNVFENENQIVIIVRDNGTGLAEDEIPRIFEKFYRSKTSKTGGIGLGLSICKAIVEIHGGHISAENNTEGGASFIIKLPLKHPAGGEP